MARIKVLFAPKQKKQLDRFFFGFYFVFFSFIIYSVFSRCTKKKDSYSLLTHCRMNYANIQKNEEFICIWWVMQMSAKKKKKKSFRFSFSFFLAVFILVLSFFSISQKKKMNEKQAFRPNDESFFLFTIYPYSPQYLLN